jgi:hypothetical protein
VIKRLPNKIQIMQMSTLLNTTSIITGSASTLSMRIRALWCDVFVAVMVMVVAIVMQGNAVELFKGVGKFTHGCSKARVKRHALNLGGSNVYTVALLDVAEVRGFDTCALVRNDRWLHVT